jgi:hypothetical protein
MKESFDQHAGQRPLPLTGSRQEAQSGGKARSSVARSAARARPAARLTRGGIAKLAEIDITPAYRSAARLSLSMTTFHRRRAARGRHGEKRRGEAIRHSVCAAL